MSRITGSCSRDEELSDRQDAGSREDRFIYGAFTRTPRVRLLELNGP